MPFEVLFSHLADVCTLLTVFSAASFNVEVFDMCKFLEMEGKRNTGWGDIYFFFFFLLIKQNEVS